MRWMSARVIDDTSGRSMSSRPSAATAVDANHLTRQFRATAPLFRPVPRVESTAVFRCSAGEKDLAGVEDIVRIQGPFQGLHQRNFLRRAAALEPGALVEPDTVFR